MKKLLTLLLVFVLAFSTFAACDKKPTGGTESGSSEQGGTSETPGPGGPEEPDVPEEPEWIHEDPTPGEDTVLDFNFAVDASAPLTYPTDPLVEPDRVAADPNATYTYNGAVDTLPTAWNSHTYQSNSATTILDYTSDSLYTFDYNLEMNGYRILPSMAEDYPEDVTAQFVGRFGIEEGAANRVYKIVLKDDLKFDNGDAITATDFVESYKRLLNPKAANYRADSHFSGNLVIAGARPYALQGSEVVTGARDIYKTWDAAKVDSAIIFDLMSDNSGFAKFGIGQGYSNYKDATYGWAGLLYAYGAIPTKDYAAPLQDKNWAEIEADASLKEIWDTIIGWWQTEPNEELDFFGRYDQMPEYDWEDVGFLANEEENALYIVNEKELTGFYLLYSLSSDFYLVHTETYDDCETTEAGVYANSYGTSVDTYVGFGPYKLTSFVADNHAKFEKNTYWHGYADPENAKYYHTTHVSIQQVSSAETRLEMFLAGDLDAYGLQAKDMEDYQSSPYTYYTDGDSTWYVALNPHFDNLRANEVAESEEVGYEVNKTILTVKEFRQALSFSIDRAAYALALDPLGGTAKALFGNMIISDPLTGTAYRTTEQAKDVILKFWGLDGEVGGDGLFETKDEAIASITGYDLAGAKALFDEAYAIAVEKGLISEAAIASGEWKIHIMIGQPGSGSSAYYNDGYELLKNVWTDAVVGTALEGRLVFEQSQPLGSSGFANYLRDNSVDVLFGVGWTGSALDPFGLMEAYVAPNYQYDPGWDTSATTLDVKVTDLDGRTYMLRGSVYDWGYTVLGGGDFEAKVIDHEGYDTGDTVWISAGANCAADIRLEILAAVEGAVLQQYDMIPINLDASAALKGMQIKYGTEEYVFGVGRGGIKYMTYYYTDAAWEAFVASNGGKLNYK